MENIQNPFSGILAGSVNDEEKIKASGLFDILEQYQIPYLYQIISSDRNPEKLREYCLKNKPYQKVVIAVAGGVPNLPIVVKSWMPDTLVISVPLEDKTDYALASLTTPSDVPVIVSGFGMSGLKKAAYITRDIYNLFSLKNAHRL